MELHNRTALITGASSGIGAAVALDLARAGMNLVLTARRGERLKDLCRQVEESNTSGSSAVFLAGDMTHSDLPARTLELAVETFGACHAVVNNAGMIETGTIDEIDLDRVGRMVRLNVEGAYRMAHEAARYFQSVGGGHLVNISSVLGTKVRPTAGAYAGTKYALEALSEALRMEFGGQGVRITCVEPGLVVTELHEHYEVHPSRELGMKEPLRPEDVAQAVRYVLEQPQRILVSRLMILPSEGQL